MLDLQRTAGLPQHDDPAERAKLVGYIHLKLATVGYHMAGAGERGEYSPAQGQQADDERERAEGGDAPERQDRIDRDRFAHVSRRLLPASSSQSLQKDRRVDLI